MKKQAGIVARSIDDLVDIVGKAGVKGNPKSLVDKTMFRDSGTGSFVLDLLGPHKKIKSFGNAYDNIQRNMADIDMKAGAKAYDFLDNRKSKGLNKLKDAFIQEQDFMLENIKDNPSKHIKVKTPGLLNPITKTKNAVVPAVGTIALANAILPSGNEDGEQNEY